MAARGDERTRSDLQAPIPRTSRERQRASGRQTLPPGVQQPSALTGPKGLPLVRPTLKTTLGKEGFNSMVGEVSFKSS